MDLQRLGRLEAEFESANVAVGEATWNIYSGEGLADLDGAQKQLASLLTNEANRSFVEGMLAEIGSGADPVLARRLAIWRNCFVGAAVDNAPEIYTLKNKLQQRIATFAFEVDGKRILRSEIQHLLRDESDREKRHQAWRAIAPLAAANGEDLRSLIGLRNRRASQLGYRDYVDLVFKLQEIDESWLRSTLELLVRESRPCYTSLIAELASNIGVRRLAPWDVTYAMRRACQLPDRYFPKEQVLDRLSATARALGFPVNSLPIRTLIRDIPFGGYNVAVKIPTDTRFLVNPSAGQAFYSTTFHEYGHSLQAVFTATPWPVLKEYEWVMGVHTAAYSEAMAEVMGDMTRRDEWLRTIAGVTEPEIRHYRTYILPAQSVVRLFELLSSMRLELAAYSETVEDMAALERNIALETRGLEFPDTDPHLWEANTWYTSYPVYWQNYILASVISAHIHDSITERFGTHASQSPEVAPYLRENFYARGGELSWKQRIEIGSGRALAADSYLRRLGK